MILPRHVYHSIFNQTVTDEEIEKTIAEDDSNDAIDYLFLFITWCALGAFVLNYSFPSETIAEIAYCAVVLFGLAVAVSMRLRTFRAIRWNVAANKVKRAKWKLGEFVALEKSFGTWTASYWIKFKDDKKEYRQYINKREYQKLLDSQTELNQMIILEYPKCCLVPVARKGHRVFDMKTMQNKSQKKFPKDWNT